MRPVEQPQAPTALNNLKQALMYVCLLKASSDWALFDFEKDGFLKATQICGAAAFAMALNSIDLNAICHRGPQRGAAAMFVAPLMARRRTVMHEVESLTKSLAALSMMGFAVFIYAQRGSGAALTAAECKLIAGNFVAAAWVMTLPSMLDGREPLAIEAAAPDAAPDQRRPA